MEIKDVLSAFLKLNTITDLSERELPTVNKNLFTLSYFYF